MAVEVSGREAEVLDAVGAGMSNAQIAHRLHLSVRTVEGHVSSLLRKYGVADRKALGAVAAAVPASASARPGLVAGLPPSRTTFVGRVVERETVASALAGGAVVTLVGPGGVGKTRLATVVAEGTRFPFGGAFVDLVPARAESLVAAVAAALDVSERGHPTLEAAVVDRLGRGPALLVLDNCEHLLGPVAAFVDGLLAACPQAAVLATSRERLGIAGERTVVVRPLPVGSDAEQLFVDRARALDPGFGADPDAVRELCARLDGLPLAIELAAARSATLGAAGLLAGLGDQLRLLAGNRGTVVRHRSLRAVIGWSHDLLDDEERAIFRRLAVFAGHFDLDAAAAVAGGGDVALVADVLGRLADKSMVLRPPGEPPRWRMLDAVRAYAREQLDGSADHAEVRARYLEWVAGAGGHPSDDVLGDLRAALATASPGPDPVVHRIAVSLARASFRRRFVHEALGHFRTAAGHAPEAASAMRDLAGAADCALVVNDTDLAFELRLAGARAAREAGDGNGEAVALARAVEMAARYPVTFRTEVPHARLVELLATARSRGDAGDPVVAARLALASAWVATPEKLSPDPVLADAAVEAAATTADPVLLSAALDAVRTVATSTGRAGDAHRVTMRRLALVERSGWTATTRTPPRRSRTRSGWPRSTRSPPVTSRRRSTPPGWCSPTSPTRSRPTWPRARSFRSSCSAATSTTPCRWHTGCGRAGSAPAARRCSGCRSACTSRRWRTVCWRTPAGSTGGATAPVNWPRRRTPSSHGWRRWRCTSRPGRHCTSRRSTPRRR
ncbi:ATP-binding protein [Pseudonocardia sp. CA-107938]|uniref:ATP-binding protein n=1 Tax=Pseudonocardia sp. CA-107938 TaxID=3240021 RepID=UPI003D933943